MTPLEIVGLVFIVYAAGYFFGIIFLAFNCGLAKSEWLEVVFMLISPPLYFMALIFSLWIRRILAMTRSRRHNKQYSDSNKDISE